MEIKNIIKRKAVFNMKMGKYDIIETKHFNIRLKQRKIQILQVDSMIHKLPKDILKPSKNNHLKLVVQDLTNKIAIVLEILKNKIILITAMIIYNLVPRRDEILVNV
jgi:hypothetical protein